MKKPQRPQLKAPDLKVPPFLADVYYDLRDRRLLPLIGVVVVATVAVPFLLGGESEEASPARARAAAAAAAAEAAIADASSLTVVQAKPGLRDYRKRLARRKPTNPFKQRYTGPVLKGAKFNTQTESATTTTVEESSGGAEETVTTETETTTGAPEGSRSGGSSKEGNGGSGSRDGAAKTPGLTLFAFAIDVRIVRSGGKSAAVREKSKKSEPVVKRRVLPLTPLPGEKLPVVTYMGPSQKGKALLLVSTDVRSVFGDARCVSGDDVCQLLEVEPGFPVTLVYGGGEVHYTVNVLKIEPVVVGRG